MANDRTLKAFTLIEMLVVVAVIVLLISILLPSLSSVRHSAQTTRCRTNLVVIFGAAVQYSQSHQGRIPAARAWVGGDWSNINSVRGGTLYSFMGGNEAAYICPVFIDTPRSIWISSYGGRDYRTLNAAFTYSLNEYMGNSWQGAHNYMKFQQADEAEKLAMFTDENPWTIPTHPTYGPLSTHPINNGAMGVKAWGPGGTPVDCIGSYHFPPGGDLFAGSSNVMFLDGHADLVHVSKTLDVVTPRRWKN